ncbi:MAG: hypothetical protein AAF223_16680, partial [Bacteroidota bacterium]
MQDGQLFRDTAKRIIESAAFGRSETYANLLNFLVESTLTGHIPKETTIAGQIFGDKEFNPNESTLVRVYVFNLRKKIAKYYQSQGEQDHWILSIPKGSYEVILDERENKELVNHTKPTESAFGKSWIFYTIITAALLLSLFLWRSKKAIQNAYQVIPESI